MSLNIQIYAGIAVLILVLIIAISLVLKKKRSAESKIEQALKPYANAELNNIIIPDGVGGLIDIEQLVLLDEGLLVIEKLPISGHLFGADKIDQWTQMFNGRSFKFPNPLYRLHLLQQALQVIVPNTPIFCRVIFTAHDSSFPKGKPEQASVLLSLEEDLKQLKQQPAMTEKQRASWDRVLRIARKDGQAVVQLTT